MQEKFIILASRSPRRKDILREAGYDFRVLPPPENEEDGKNESETPNDYVLRLAREKAESVANLIREGRCGFAEREFLNDPRFQRGIVLGCDTIVLCCGEILGKPRDREDAGRMLRNLAGNDHRVLTGICLVFLSEGKTRADYDTTVLRMNSLREEEIEDYLDSNLWEGKAGAFGLQDRNDWIRIIRGSESNVVGLPLELLEKCLN